MIGNRARYMVGLTILIIGIVFLVLQMAFRQDEITDDTRVNEALLHTERFSLTTESTALQTSAEGTIFVFGEQGIAKRIQIVSAIEIDPDDWGGVAFSIPDYWYISNITSSYPEGASQSIIADSVATWTTTNPEFYGWRAFIEVGRDRSSHVPSGGGRGTVVIDIVPGKNVDQPEILYIGVEAGSADKGTHKVIGTDHIKVPVSTGTSE